MKVNIKHRYKEFLSYIEFPTLIYYYETNRLIGMNEYAIEILGFNVKNIKELTLNELRPRLSKELLNNGSKRIRQYTIYTKQGEKTLDFEINAYMVDDKHVCIVFFEYSYKNVFEGNQGFVLPRLYWKNKGLYYIGMNESFKEDIQYSEKACHIMEEKLQNKDIFREEEYMLNEEEYSVLKSKQPIYERIGMLTVQNNRDLFLKYSLMPIVNKNGTSIGILGLYHHIVGRETRRQEFSDLMGHIYKSCEKRKKMMTLLSQILHLSSLKEESSFILERIFELLRKDIPLKQLRILGCPEDVKIVHQIFQSEHISVNRYKNMTRRECMELYKRVKKQRKKENEEPVLSSEIIFPCSIIGYEAGLMIYEYKNPMILSKELQVMFQDISKIIEIMLVKERLYEYYNKEIWENNKE